MAGNLVQVLCIYTWIHLIYKNVHGLGSHIFLTKSTTSAFLYCMSPGSPPSKQCTSLVTFLAQSCSSSLHWGLLYKYCACYVKQTSQYYYAIYMLSYHSWCFFWTNSATFSDVHTSKFGAPEGFSFVTVKQISSNCYKLGELWWIKSKIIEALIKP